MADCPPSEMLRSLLAEKLSDDEQALVETHVEECTRCQAKLHQLTLDVAGPTSPRSILPPTSRAGKANPLSEAFFDRLKQIKPPTSINGDEDASSHSDAGAPDRIDAFQYEGYQTLGELGRGATGVVYRARHLKLDRFVALKVIIAGPHLSPELRQRFRLEALAIARLQHKNIVQIYDVGEHAQCPFLSLELVEGRSLADWMAGKPKTADEAARIIATLASAVEYAHTQGVIHRDLKPGNVLLSVPPGSKKTELKITDFGIAKVLPQAGLAEAHMTQTGEILGTPAYMAPEQARGNASEISPATDVYSLGAILYELLTGRPPFQGATPLDTLMQAARQDAVSIALLISSVPKDLDTICLKCLEKEPLKRYPTAGALADDVRRFLRNEPILARPLSKAGHSIRWMRRHQGLAAALAGVAFLLVLLTVSSLVASAHFRTLEREQRALAHDKSELADEKESERLRAVVAEQHESELRQQAQREGQQLRQNLYFDQMNLAGQAAMSPGGIARVGEWLAPWKQTQPDLRNWEWFYLNGLCHRELFTLPGSTGGVAALAWSPDGRAIAFPGPAGTIGIWSAADGQAIRRMNCRNLEVRGIAWSPDGRKIATANWDGTLKVWDATTSEELLSMTTGRDALLSVAWSPDGTRLASAGFDLTIRTWNARTGAADLVLRGHTAIVRDVAWSPDGKRLASAGADNDVRIWDASAGTPLLTLHGHSNFVNRVAWSSDGAKLASASNDLTAKIWDPSTGAELQTLHGHSLGVTSIAWSPGGDRLVTGSDDQTLKVWRAADGSELFTLRGHTQSVFSVAWSADGTRLASGSADTTVKLWDAEAGPETRSLSGHLTPVLTSAWAGDGKRLALGSANRTVEIWDTTTRAQPIVLQGHTNQVLTVAWSPDNTQLASAGNDQTIRIWSASDGRQLSVWPSDPVSICSLAWSRDGQKLASAGFETAVRIWNPATGKQTQVFQGHNGYVRSVAWSPDGQRLASASDDHTVRVWNATTGQQILCMSGHHSFVTAVVWSPDGKVIASAGYDQMIKLWNALTGEPLLTLRGHTSRISALAWSPDQTRLASASDDRTVKLWDTTFGRETMSFDCHSGFTNTVAWSPDGLVLATGGDGDSVVLHDVSPGYTAARAPQYLPALNQAIASDPNNLPARITRAEIEARVGNWSDAGEDLKRVVALNKKKRWCTLGYWVAGPYPDDLRASYAPEISTNPVQSATQSIESDNAPHVIWNDVLYFGSGFLDFGELFDHAAHISGYAMLRVYSPETQSVGILVGSDDQLRLWLNGKIIHEFLLGREAVPDQDAVSATLAKGWNTLLARVVNVAGDHALYLRLSDAPADLQRAKTAGK